MVERKWMGYIYLRRRQREDFNDEYNSIASKVAIEWLLENKYEIYSFKNIMIKVANISARERALALKRSRKHGTSERVLEYMKKKEEFLIGLFGEGLENIIKYRKAIRKLSDEAKIGLLRDHAYFGVGPDFIVKKDHEVFFVVIDVYQAKPKKYHEASCKIAKKYGFKTMTLKLDVEIRVGEVSLKEL